MTAHTITNKIVVVTGGSRGIGLEWTKQLLQQGNTVVATGRSPATAAGLQELTAQYGDKLITAQLDTASEESIVQWAEALKDKVSHIDVLINNAGIALETFEHGVADLSSKTLADTFAVNTYGPVLVVQQLLRQGLLGGGTPSLVVYTSSIMGSMGGYAFPQAKMYAYRASKTALNMLAVAMMGELSTKNITTVLMHPGYVATDMTAGHPGTISTIESVVGQLKILQDGRPLDGKFFSYTGDELAF